MRIADGREAYWTPEERAEYARRIREATAQVNALDGTALTDVQTLLQDLRAEVVDRISWAQAKADAGASAFDLGRLGQLNQDISAMFLELQARFPQTAAEWSSRMANLSAAVVDVPIRLVTGGEQLGMFGLSRSIASASALVQSSLITRVSRETVWRISNEIALGASGLKSPFEVMQAVGSNLTEPSIFGSIAARAEVIVRTELGRVQSVAGQARQEEAAQLVPGLSKQWVHEGHSRKPRPAHVAAHGQIVDVHDDFTVGGERLTFPRDPKGSPENTINCGCGSYPYIAGLSQRLEKAA